MLKRIVEQYAFPFSPRYIDAVDRKSTQFAFTRDNQSEVVAGRMDAVEPRCGGMDPPPFRSENAAF